MVLDVTEAATNEILVTFDPISTMAQPDKAQLEVLLSPAPNIKSPIANAAYSILPASRANPVSAPFYQFGGRTSNKGNYDTGF